ncbi:hypothetical protein BVC80_1667g11 [Macleaya cordata]|uniref:Uncharacterized protein n=1 Tax=Macleaya cordata TaxID=56857 RepID=A0A200RBD6_MACCD|nr:hypothetical protein BVC80_1667g11 [Macleaya cordata]
MKASLKFRDDQKPLFRAKVPLNILGCPFQSGIEAGDTKEFCLNLSTFFESGPSLKFSYRPNDSWNPFSVIVKTGIGAFGSPISAPMSMSAEFNLLGSNGNPSFFLHFKPQIGDFSIKKSATSLLPLQSSDFMPKIIKLTPANTKDLDSDAEESVDGGGGCGGVEIPLGNGVYQQENNGGFSGKKLNGFSTGKTNAVNAIDRLFNGIEMNATTVLPVRNRALVKFRWGVRFPTELKNPPMVLSSSLRKIPFLVMSKISLEHVAESKSAESTKRDPSAILAGNADVAATWLAVKRDLEVLQVENGLLRKATEELRSEIGAAGNSGPIVGSQVSGKNRECERNGGKKSLPGKNDRDRRSSEKKASAYGGFTGNMTDGDVNGELKKDLMGTNADGI